MNRNTDFIPFARPSFSEAEKDAVIRVLQSGWLTTGSVTADLERKTAETAGVKHALAVNSATSGLHLALEASAVKAGDYVITSPYTFTSTAEVIRYLGAHPLFVDIEPGGYNINPEKMAGTIETRLAGGDRVSAVMPVHIAGQLCRRREINDIAGAYKLAVIEDGAHLQPGPLLTDKKNILVYSFYATKCITTGEGGMVITNNDDAAGRMRTMRFHGIDREAWDRYRKKGAGSWTYDIIAPGYKYNLPDILSAVGLVQMDRSAEMLSQRKEIARKYDSAFSNCDFLKIPPADENSSRHLYILRIVPGMLTKNRDEIVGIINEKGIGLSVHYKPLHMMSYYSRKYNLAPGDFPESLDRYNNSFSIPIYPDLTDNEISRIIETIMDIGNRYRRNDKIYF